MFAAVKAVGIQLNYSTFINQLAKANIQINRKMLPEVESIFVLADSRYFFVSSSIIKEVALLGGDVSELVPESVKAGLTEKRQLRLE